MEKELDQFSWGARAFPTILKVNSSNICSGSQLTSPIYIDFIFLNMSNMKNFVSVSYMFE